MFREFKQFAMQGNVVDLAVGVIIGAAFGAIVNSVVQDVVMPVFGVVTGGLDFSQRFALLRDGNPAGPYATLAAAKAAGASTMNYGLFLNAVVNFIIVATALFLVVKTMNRARRRDQPVPAAPPAPPAPSNEERLLTEIRDLLRGSIART
ncbi:MAG TPA: large conductance mechanosensitive channel protein MscL [Vicinamibacterales bacterium]|nr:large conductance mechanosensitive channel protein MscL [Vicinamibacterales bacterium]